MTNAPCSSRRLNYQYFLMQMGFWAMFAAICAYQTALLLGRGFSNGQVGLILSMRCLSGIIFQPALGGFADRHPSLPIKRIVALSMSLSFCANLALMQTRPGLAGTIVLFIIMGGFEISSYPLVDAMAIQYINAGIPIRYSLGRGLGSLSYAACCILLGYLVKRFGVESALVLHGILIVVEIVIVTAYPTFRAVSPAKYTPAGDPPHSIPALLRYNRRFTLMLAAILLGMTGIIPVSNFLVNIIVDRGGTASDLGLGLSIMTSSELVTAFFFPRLRCRLGSGRVVVLSLAFCGVKVLALLLSPCLAAVYLAQPLQMLGYGLFTPISVFYTNESVPPADRVRGQTIMMVASNGMGGVLGNLLGGRAVDCFGVNGMLLCSLACCMAGTALGLFSLRLRDGQIPVFE